MANYERFANKRKADITLPDVTHSVSSQPSLPPALVSSSGSSRDDLQISSDWILSQERERNELNKDTKADKSKEVDSLLAEELLKMSFVDRNTVNEEIHGVRSLAIEETPMIIANALNSFRIELELLPSEEKRAYLFINAYRQQMDHHHHRQQRQRTNSYNGMQQSARVAQTGTFAAYVDDDNFRLRFLRCCLFKVSVAVRRFANYLNFIQTHWGNSYLARPIQLIDLDANELKILKRGFTQIFPFRDRRGRRIVANLGDGSDMEDIAFVKVWFYVFDSVSRDSIETQRNGVVSIVDGSHYASSRKDKKTDFFLLNKETSKRVGDLFRLGSTLSPLVAAHLAMPTRLVSAHLCWPHTPLLKTILKVYFFHTELTGSTSALDLNRVRIHSGLETEMRYRVKSYGVPIELLPLTGTNAIKVNYHNQWLKTRRLVETNQNKFQYQYNSEYKPEYECGIDIQGGNNKLVTIVECPCSNDIVFRNGTQSMENPGNVMFRNSILSYWADRERSRSASVENNKNTSDGEKKNKASLSSSASDDAQDRNFRDKLVRDVEVEKKGRFLEWDKNLNVWVQMMDKARIHRKVGMAFYNCTKRRYNNNSNSAYSSGKNKKRAKSTSVIKDSTSLAFQFIDKGRSPTLSNGKESCFGAACSGSGSSDDDESKKILIM